MLPKLFETLRNSFSAFVIVILLVQNVFCVEKEFFSAVTGMENLLQTELHLLAELQNYVDTAMNDLQALQSEIIAIRKEHLTASGDLEDYLTNPINTYRLIKRLHNDWNTFENSVREDVTRDNFLNAMTVYRKNFSFPTENDVSNSALALVRLQETYQLDVSELAKGILNGIKYGPAMTWQDCFLLGHHLFMIRNFNETVPWLKQSMQLLFEKDYVNEATTLDFMETVVGYYHEMGDFDSALNLVNKILHINPERNNMITMKPYLEQKITDGIKQGYIHETAPIEGHYHQSNEFKLYKKICRAEVAITPQQQRSLRCRYHTNNVPFRLLQPFKMEELFLDPYIVQFHDVITDSQMNIIKRMAAPRMKRSLVRALDGVNATTSNFRTSKSAWFRYKEHRITNKMRLHVQDFSGLDLRFAEDLQVANYGIGGHYEPHFDFFDKDASFDPADGNRAATAIYYLSDVVEGGSTGFPYLPLLVKPEKGSVLFWYNLHRSEDPDYRTKHAACPVLKGTKWIANIWIRARGQFHTRQCDLHRDHEISLKYKD